MTYHSGVEHLMLPKMKVLTLAVLLICSGCAVGPDFKRPEAPAVTGLTRESGANTPATR